MEVAIADDMDYMYSARDAHYPKPIGMPADFNHLHIRTNFPETWIWREVTLR